MLEYIKAKDYKHLVHIINLWNWEYKSLYPIDKKLFKSLVLDDANFNADASYVAMYDHEPVGFIFIKNWLTESGLANENDTAYISLIFVKKEMRNMGIGSDMLTLSINELKKFRSIKKLVVGNEIRKVFPGVPNELVDTPIFFMNKGFVQTDSSVDMIRVARSDLVDEDIDHKGMEIRIATEDDKDDILRLCVKNEWFRESYLIDKYFYDGGSGRRIVVGIIDNKIMSFVRFNDENNLPSRQKLFTKDKSLGYILYAKIDKEYQGSEYEEILNQEAKNYLLKRGCKKVIVLATKNLRFYKKIGYSACKYYLNFEYYL